MKNIEKLAEYGEKVITDEMRRLIWSFKCLKQDMNYLETNPEAYEDHKDMNRRSILTEIKKYRDLRKTAVEHGLDVNDYDSKLEEHLCSLNKYFEIPISIREELELGRAV